MSSKVRLLIVDNSKDFVWLLVRYLSKCADIEIVGVAYDGEQAIQMVKQIKPDVLLLDIIMPNMNGFMVLSEIWDNKDFKIIAMSALSSERMIENAMGFGVAGYLIKPFNLNDLYSEIKRCAQVAFDSDP